MKNVATLLIGLVILLTTGVVWSYGRYAEAQDAMAEAAGDAGRCDSLAQEIRSRQAKPTVARDQERIGSEMTGRIETAAGKVGISADRLLRITPESAVRLGDTPYQAKPTRVFLRDASLEQIVRLTHDLVADDEQLRCQSLRITAPRHEDARDRWAAEIVLTYLIYRPQEPLHTKETP